MAPTCLEASESEGDERLILRPHEALLNGLREQQALHEDKIEHLLRRHEERIRHELSSIAGSLRRSVSRSALAGGGGSCDSIEVLAPESPSETSMSLLNDLSAGGSGGGGKVSLAWSNRSGTGREGDDVKGLLGSKSWEGAGREQTVASPEPQRAGSETSSCVSPDISAGKSDPSVKDTSRYHAKRASSAKAREILGITAAEAKRNSMDSLVEDESSQDDTERRCCLRAWANKLASHKAFEVTMAVIILLNAGVLGWQADWGVKHVFEEQPALFVTLEYFFAIVFSFELVTHMLDEGWHFCNYQNGNFVWNMFDSFIVLSTWGEDIVKLATSTSVNVSALRIARLLRLVRILRIIRVMRFFRELRLMVQGILVSLKPLIWCIILLTIVMFSVGMIILQVTIIELTDHPEVDHTVLLDSFGGIIVTMYTLYKSMTGGVDWGDPAAELSKISFIMSVLYCIFMAFSVLCMLNIVTGVFVENANTITRSDTDDMVMEELAVQEKRLEEMHHLMVGLAGDGRAQLSEQQFLEFSQVPKVQAYFRKIGLNVEKENAAALFRLIDLDSDGAIQVQEFVEGCTQFIGNARQLDIARLRRENNKTAELLKDFFAFVLDPTAATKDRREQLCKVLLRD